MKVFLGGTCAESKWRDILIPKLKCEYFNPVVEDWTPECQEIEELEKYRCDYHLYVITPKMKGVFSIAEAVNDSYKIKEHCIFCVTKEEDDRDWTKGEKKSLDATAKMIKSNGGVVLYGLEEIADFLNSKYDEYNAINYKEQMEYYKKRAGHLSELYDKLAHEILPEGWYSMAADTWGVEEDMCEDCIRRLNRSFVKKIIKRNNF